MLAHAARDRGEAARCNSTMALQAGEPSHEPGTCKLAHHLLSRAGIDGEETDGTHASYCEIVRNSVFNHLFSSFLGGGRALAASSPPQARRSRRFRLRRS